MADIKLLGDIGGTHARFALQRDDDPAFESEAVYDCKDYPGALEMVEHYLRERTDETPQSAAIGIAAPVRGDRVEMTNLKWVFSIAAMKASMGLQRLLVINDFTALALALPVLDEDELRPVGDGVAAADAAWGLLGAGTGLGVGGLLPVPGGGYAAIAGEGGHATLAGGDDWENSVLAVLRREFGHVSAERALSGPGIVNLYKACAEVAGEPFESLSGPAISQRAKDKVDPLCVQAIGLFFKLLGSVAGNLALTLGARRGVFIGGGIVPELGDMIDNSEFRLRFTAKGRYEAYLAEIPTYVIDAKSPPALRGAAQALRQPAERL
ncbi:glucokinase [Piscinibacter sakaiensis]|uniref:glucokinase n=1 Tax=Piscinibacter sakaiensis TaxID=1547922 RepID=UPI003AAF63E7